MAAEQASQWIAGIASLFASDARSCGFELICHLGGIWLVEPHTPIKIPAFSPRR